MGALYKLIFFSTDITNLQKITIMKGHKNLKAFFIQTELTGNPLNLLCDFSFSSIKYQVESNATSK